MQKIKKLVAGLKLKKGLVLMVLGVMVAGLVLVGQSQPAIAAVTCPDGSVAETLADCNVPEKNDTLIPTVMGIIKVVLGVLGFVAAVMIIFGGVQYVTSAGDAAKVAKAKNTIIFAVVGLVISLLAFAIVNFVLTDILV